MARPAIAERGRRLLPGDRRPAAAGKVPDAERDAGRLALRRAVDR